LYACDLYYGGYGPSLAISRLAVLNRVAQLRHGGRSVSILGYDFCGMPIVAYGPSQPTTRFRPTGQPRNPKDSVAFPGSTKNFPREVPIGTFPMTRRAELPQMGDVTIKAPRPNKNDPRDIFMDSRNETRGVGSAERSRAPVERSAPPRTETGFIGTQPSRENSKPLFREAPPQRSEPTQRVPDRSPPPPPPVVHQQPSSPPPPPPRTQAEPRSRPVADPIPPRKH
jgi:hypothetical protein